MMTIEDIAKDSRDDDTAIQLLFAFNSVGKTRLSVAYKNATRNEDGKRTGIYYNAYSEDLFLWDNDISCSDECNLLGSYVILED
ncbi:MAG: anticodon nuclease, partial [Bacteroidetes bacterium]|nr:anticodon nuclease [Bacteroidota bacterium]